MDRKLQLPSLRLVYFGILPYLASGPFALSLQDSIFRRCTGFLAPSAPVFGFFKCEAGRIRSLSRKWTMIRDVAESMYVCIVPLKVLVVRADLHHASPTEF